MARHRTKMKSCAFLAVALCALVAFLPAAAHGSDGFYVVHATTIYCETDTSCDTFTGPGTQQYPLITLFGHAGKRVGRPDDVVLFCQHTYTDASGIRRQQNNRFNHFAGAAIQGVAGVLTPGETTASTYTRSFAEVSVSDLATETSASVKGHMITNNVTHTLLDGGINFSITGWLENWVIGLGQFGELDFFPDTPFTTYGTISCSASTNGFSPDFFGEFPFQ